MMDLDAADTSKVFNLNSSDTLVKLFRSGKIFALSSLFADDILLRAEDDGFAECPRGERRVRALVHAWHLKTLEQNCRSPMFSSGSSTALRDTRLIKLEANTTADSFRLPYALIKKNDEVSEMFQKVGIYIPLLPPLVSILLTSGKTKVSERILLEIATLPEEKERLLLMENLYSNNGALRIAVDPLEYYHQRPALYNSDEDNTLLHHLPGRVHQAGSYASSLQSACELQVSLTQISLYDHPLFGPEDRLYAQMRLLYGEYHRYLKPQTVNYIRLKLQMLLDAVARCRLRGKATFVLQNTRDLGWDLGREQTTKLCFRCFQTLETMTLGQQAMSDLTEALYTTWNQLKGLRQHQGFTATPAKLVAINVVHADQHDMSKTPHARPTNALLDKFQEMLYFMAQHAALTPNGRCREYLISLFRRCRSRLIPASAFVLKLYITAELTHDDDKSLPIQEVMRRRRVRQQHLYAILLVNRHKVAKTNPQTIMWPSFTICLDQPLRLKISRQNMRLEFQVWQRRLLIDIHLATMQVPTPEIVHSVHAASSQTINPSVNWLQFASTGVVWDVGFVVGEEVKMLLRKQNATILPKLYRDASQGHFWVETKKEQEEVWACGVVAAVRWRRCDIRIQGAPDCQDQLYLSVPCTRIRRKSVALEVSQRRISGAALVSLNWTVRHPESIAPEQSPNDHCKTQPTKLSVVSSMNQQRECDPNYYFSSSLPSLSNVRAINPFPTTINRLQELDPNDPSCASALAFRPIVTKSECESSKLFRASESSTRPTFLAASSVPSRHFLLRLRMYQATLLNQPVPATDVFAGTNVALEELTSQFNSRRRRAIKKHKNPDIFEEPDYKQTYKKRDYELLAFVQQVQDSVAERGYVSNTPLFPLSALISEGTPLPQLRARGLVDAALEFTVRRRRTLRPLRQRRAAITSSIRDCSLLVQVISAHKLIERVPDLEIDEEKAASHWGLSDKLIASGIFVSVTFQEHCRRTMLAMGHTPRWKETLDLPFTPPLADFSPANLMRLNECLRLSLFLESVSNNRHELEHDQGDAYNSAHLRRKFLGDVEVPFTTLYCNGGTDGYLEGKFRLSTPAVCIYMFDLQIPSSQSSLISHDVEASTKQAKTASYLHLAIFLRPSLSAPIISRCIESSFEEERLVRYGVKWIQQLRLYFENINEFVKRPVDKRIKRRVVQVFGNNMKGDAVLICRYLCAQEPPPGVNTFTRAARFVSLTPFLEDWKSFGCPNLDIWCTSQEFLDVGAGDWEEHAVLLHNFFCWLSQDSSHSSDLYLVVGSGIPEGNTIYVMQHLRGSQMNSVFLWNACTGLRYSSIIKQQCPIIDIGCMLNSTNIYANLQENTAPSVTSFDINDGSLWRPFFSSSSSQTSNWFDACACACNAAPSRIPRPATLVSIQELQLRYDAPDIIFAEQIQVELTEEIKTSLRCWRTNNRARHLHTSFNVDISRRLQNLLPTLEALQESESLASIRAPKLNTLGLGQIWNIEAMAFNMAYANMKSITERLRATDLHSVVHRDVQFALGVYIHPIIHHIFSVTAVYKSTQYSHGFI